MNGNCWLFVIHYSLFSIVIPIYQSTVNNEERTVAARFSNLCAKPGLVFFIRILFWRKHT